MNRTNQHKQPQRIPSPKEWQRLKMLNHEQKEIIAAKERSLLLHIEEMDELRNQNRMLERKLKNSQTHKGDLKKLIREFAMRITLFEPETEKDNRHLQEGLTSAFDVKLRKTIKYKR
nr:hypothetical protein [uncultured Draconibacterium sp.]